MNKLTLPEALQKWSEGKTVLVSLDITSLKLEDLQKLNEMGAIFSYEVPVGNAPGISEPTMSFREMLGPVSPQKEDPGEEFPPPKKKVSL